MDIAENKPSKFAALQAGLSATLGAYKQSKLRDLSYYETQLSQIPDHISLIISSFNGNPAQHRLGAYDIIDFPLRTLKALHKHLLSEMVRLQVFISEFASTSHPRAAERARLKNLYTACAYLTQQYDYCVERFEEIEQILSTADHRAIDSQQRVCTLLQDVAKVAVEYPYISGPISAQPQAGLRGPRYR